MQDQELLSLCNKHLDYNPDTGVFIWKKATANCVKVGDAAGTKNTAGYLQVSLKGKRYMAHRLAFLMTYKHLPKVTDHINGIKDDNRISNLRECTQTENCRNSKVSKNAKSGYKGVCWNNHGNKWRSYIRINCKTLYFGSFTCKHEAAKAYNEAALKYYGEFAWLNIIRER